MLIGYHIAGFVLFAHIKEGLILFFPVNVGLRFLVEVFFLADCGQK
jgi:hypothetical protein